MCYIRIFFYLCAFELLKPIIFRESVEVIVHPEKRGIESDAN